jgi:hypothetical protein
MQFDDINFDPLYFMPVGVRGLKRCNAKTLLITLIIFKLTYSSHYIYKKNVFKATKFL